MKKKHRTLADKLTSNFPPQTILDWRSMVDAWDKDHNKPDPYEEPEHGQYTCLLIYLKRSDLV